MTTAEDVASIQGQRYDLLLRGQDNQTRVPV